MAYKIDGSTIVLTRGDSLSAQLAIKEPDGKTWTPSEGDSVRFKVVKNYPTRHGDGHALIEKTFGADLMLVLDPQDTEPLRFGDYHYDVQVSFADGRVDTIIDRATLRITQEVD